MEKSYEDMVSELVEFYETAGFAGIYERAFKDKTPEQIAEMYQELVEFEALDNDEWDRRPEDE